LNARATGYELKKIVDLSEQDRDTYYVYGSHIIYFTSVVGGSVLALHGGETDENGHLLPTEGSLRVSSIDLLQLVELLAGESNVTLDMREDHMGFLQRAFAPKVSSLSAPQVKVPVVREADGGTLSSPIFWLLVYMWYSSNSDVQGEMTVVPPFNPGDGTFGGAGASGDFETPAVVETAVPQETEMPATTLEAALPLIVDPFAVSTAAVVREVESVVMTSVELVREEAVVASVAEAEPSVVVSSADQAETAAPSGTAY
jgi:hypothetical protein